MANPWNTNCDDYPDFVGSDCVQTIPIDCGVVGVVTAEIDNIPWLEGMTIAILADGEVQPQQTVQNNKVTLDGSFAKVHYGLPFISDLETLNINIDSPFGTIQGKKIQVGNVTFRIVQTRGGWIGKDEQHLYPNAFDNAILSKLGTQNLAQLFTGDIRRPQGGGYEDGGRTFYRQYDPLPVNINAIISEVAIGGASG